MFDGWVPCMELTERDPAVEPERYEQLFSRPGSPAGILHGYYIPLLNRHRLRQISRLIHIRPLEIVRVIRQQLQRVL